jgi:hypothetical protein
MFIFPPWSSREIVAGLLTWLFLVVWWHVEHRYSLEVDDNSARVGGESR